MRVLLSTQQSLGRVILGQVSWLSLLVFLSVACQPLVATTPLPTRIDQPTIPHATLVYYDISGTTDGELRAQLDRLGPTGYDNYKGDAATTWYIAWQWPNDPDGSCRLSETVVSYAITVTLPHWNPPTEASNDLIVRWNEYLTALTEHEKGHVALVLANLPNVEQAIKGATCAMANAVGERQLAEIRSHDIDFDRTTNHGIAQGATFP